MAPRSNTLEQARTLLQERLRELDTERDQVMKALEGLGGARRGPGRPRGSRKASGGGTARRRRRRGATRRDQAIKIVGAEPGVSAGAIAKQMKIAPNYMYRVMGELEKEGAVRKEGRGYFPPA